MERNFLLCVSDMLTLEYQYGLRNCRFLDVGQTSGSTNTSIRNCRNCPQYSESFVVSRVSSRLLGDYSSRMERHRSITVGQLSWWMTLMILNPMIESTNTTCSFDALSMLPLGCSFDLDGINPCARSTIPFWPIMEDRYGMYSQYGDEYTCSLDCLSLCSRQPTRHTSAHESCVSSHWYLPRGARQGTWVFVFADSPCSPIHAHYTVLQPRCAYNCQHYL